MLYIFESDKIYMQNYHIKILFNIIAVFILFEVQLCERWNIVKEIILIKYFAGAKDLKKTT